MSESLIGQTIGKYEIVEQLGRGGMAEVYKAYQKNLDRFVAIKLMHPFLVAEEDFRNRFHREAKAMAALNHPHIVSIFDFDLYKENTYYLVMEYINGGTLKDKLERLAEREERLPVEESVRTAIELADALAYAHNRNMIHRDIKPANIMLDEESGRAILTDFGIVKLVGGQSMAYTATGALIGTPAYMSPEQALGQSGDERVDIYSMGVLLFQMVTGQLPFNADTPLAVVMKHVNEPTPNPVSFNPDISIELQTIILRSMAKISEDRYQSAGDLAAALRTVQLPGNGGEGQRTAVSLTKLAEQAATMPRQTFPGKTAVVQPTAVAKPAPAEEKTAAPKKRPFWHYAGLVVLLLAITAGAIFGLRGGNRPQPTAAAVAKVLPVPTTPKPTNTAVPPTKTAVPQDTPDTAATQAVALALTETARPTMTAVPTDTATPTQTPTPDATLEFLAACSRDVELIVAYSYQSQSSSAAPVGVSFPMHWRLKNSGTCPWPAGAQWIYVEGNDLGMSEPISLETEVPADEEITLTAELKAPATVNTFNSTWQLVDENGDPIGSPVNFNLITYIPATATPRPTDTPIAPTPTPTSEIVELNYAFEIASCEYVGDDWRCRVHLTPYGGGGGPYTMFIFLNPIVELRGDFSYDYFVQARRCAAWNTEIKVIDEATNLEMSRHLYVDPDLYIPGGCVKP